MRRTTPPLQVRGDVLRAWTALGTPSEVCRRLQGAHGRGLVNTVRDWATLHGFLVQRPPMGLQLTATGLRWLAELDAGLDPDARRRTSYQPPTELPKPRAPKVATVQRGSIPDRVLRHLHRHGSECNSELARVLQLPVRRVRNAARTLQLGQLVTATPERRTVESAVCTREAVVMVYRCTEAGREALKGAK